MESPLCHISDLKVIETLRWCDRRFQRIDRHLNRAKRTCVMLGIPFSEVNAIEVLEKSADKPDMRIRLTVARDGLMQVTAATFTPLPDGTVWKLEIAQTKLQSNDPALQVKTTARALYDETRTNLSQQTDEMIFANERGEICEGTITNIFADFGEGLITPPVSSGLLPGILREELLENEDCIEGIVKAQDLPDAKRLYVGNSLRGLIPAKLI